MRRLKFDRYANPCWCFGISIDRGYGDVMLGRWTYAVRWKA